LDENAVAKFVVVCVTVQATPDILFDEQVTIHANSHFCVSDRTLQKLFCSCGWLKARYIFNEVLELPAQNTSCQLAPNASWWSHQMRAANLHLMRAHSRT
jgi:hypothetical protein